MPLYGFHNLTDVCVSVCVYILQRLSVRSYLCQFHLHLKTLFGPRTVQEICLWNFSTMTAKKFHKERFECFFVFLII